MKLSNETVVRPFFVTHDIFRDPSEDLEDEFPWVAFDYTDPSGEVWHGSQRESPISIEDHELLYETYDDDKVLVAKGTTTAKESFANQRVGLTIFREEYQGWNLAERYHLNDAGAVSIKLFDRVTKEEVTDKFT